MKLMEERLINNSKKLQVKAASIPDWAKTSSESAEVEGSRTGIEIGIGIGGEIKAEVDGWAKKRMEKKLEKADVDASADVPPPPPNPEVGQGQDEYEDDFEPDHLDLEPTQNTSINDTDLLNSSISIVAVSPHDNHDGDIDVDIDDDEESPNLFYESVDDSKFSSLFQQNMVDVVEQEKNEIVEEEVEEGEEEEERNDSVYEKCFVQVANGFRDMATKTTTAVNGDEVVRSSITKDFFDQKKNEKDDDDVDVDVDVDLSELEKSIDVPELSLSEMRQELKAKQTKDAVTDMRSKLKDMGLLATLTEPDNINILEKSSNNDDYVVVEEVVEPQVAEEVAVEVVDTIVAAIAATTAEDDNLASGLVGLSFAETADPAEVGIEVEVEVEQNTSFTGLPTPPIASPALSPKPKNASNQSFVSDTEFSNPNPNLDSNPNPNVTTVSRSQVRRPKSAYKQQLEALSLAMSNAVEMYLDLLESRPSDVLEESVGGEAESALEDSESLELLTSFRDSFASLQGKMASAFSNSVSHSMSTSNMPSILEDSCSNFPDFGAAGGRKRPILEASFLMSQSQSQSQSNSNNNNTTTTTTTTNNNNNNNNNNIHNGSSFFQSQQEQGQGEISARPMTTPMPGTAGGVAVEELLDNFSDMLLEKLERKMAARRSNIL